MLPTGEQYEIVSGDIHAVVTEVGAGLRALVHGERHLVETYAEDARPARGWARCSCRGPTARRDGRWRWNGADQQLALTEPEAGNAIHGLLRHVLYRVHERADDAITLVAVIPPQPGWPVALATGIRYAVDGEGLTVTHTVRNVGRARAVRRRRAPLPARGRHPHRRLRAHRPRRAHHPARGRPAHRPRPAVPAALDLRGGRVKELDLDNAFGGAAPADGDTHIRHHLAAPDGTTELWADPVFGYVQVFTPSDLVGAAAPSPSSR